MAQARPEVNRGTRNLMAVLRESMGANKQEETLKPLGKLKGTLPDGEEVKLELAAFEFLGDMHIRFVFDAPLVMHNATPEDLSRLKLNPNVALELAVANIKRVYGTPKAMPWRGGVMLVQGKSPDLDSSYFLDRDFWRSVLKQHREGLAVAVPKRGGLLFTPLRETEAVESLRKGVAYLHSSSEQMRISSALYLFKDDRWTVFQPPQETPLH